jgi:hypothetical protein
MSQQPLSVTVSPLKTVLPKGQLHATEHVTVRNSGSGPITIHTASLTVGQAARGCGVGRSNGWLSAIPAAFHLKPGQEQTVTVTIDAPHTATGTVDTVALITASGKSPHGADTVGGAIGSQFIVTATGTTHAPVCGHPVALPNTTGGSPPVGLLAALVGAVLITGACMVAFGRSWRRRRRSNRPAYTSR